MRRKVPLIVESRPEFDPARHGTFQSTECQWCHAPVGQIHADGCFAREKTVLVEMVFECVMRESESWSAQEIEFVRNDARWCGDNALTILEHQAERMTCLCSSFRLRVVREATQEDEDKYGVSIEDAT